jgi:3-hydroxymyristoyl/3-hydroxydecanoyl-(acyl carrier protein) dehydratase
LALLAEVPVTVAASHRAFEGHFEHEPVLPGVVLLELVAEAIRKALGPDRWLAGVPWLRWRAVVRPGDGLQIRIEGLEAPDEVAFEVRRGSELISNGRLLTARGAP